jgi:hypothetical protein
VKIPSRIAYKKEKKKMGQLADKVVKLSETLSIAEFSSGGAKGFWLYDKTRGMNISMRAKSETDALVDALEYH